ncbi:MAG: putative baseplate assembly protein [Actinomycetota bacterium]
MALPVPKLDDREFQDLVDDAKRFIRDRCPEWTDHNVSDPGVTLIEAFAWMTDLLLYRLNRVPERVQLRFLDLIGLRLFPPSAATVAVDFAVSAPQDAPLSVSKGTVVATRREAGESVVEFSTIADLSIEVGSVVYVATGGRDGPVDDLTPRLGLSDSGLPIFTEEPSVGDALYVGFDKALPRHSVRLRVSNVRGAGAGIRTSAPPIVWEALVGGEWVACDWEDGTRGFNVDGVVEVHIPDGHQTTPVDSPDVDRVGLIRCRVKGITASEADKGMVPYQRSPLITGLDGYVSAATVDAINARFVEHEVLGESRGVAGQEFQLQHAPVVISDEAFVVSIAHPALSEEIVTEGHDLPRDAATAWEHETWELVSSFSESGPDDRHFTLDRSTGIVRFGPLIRGEDGSAQFFGSVPSKGAIISVPRYRVGGGRSGNVAAGALQVLRTSIPSIARVRNRRPGVGGADGETVEEGMARGPVELRTRNRAVTVEDFESLTREADPQIQRARCIVDDEQQHAVRVLMVPAVGHAGTQLRLDDLEPSVETCERVQRYLDERRLVGTRVRPEPPEYAGLRVRAQIVVEERQDPEAVREAALRALYMHFDPLVGGRDGRGWEFGRSIRIGEVYGVLQRVQGVDVVSTVTIAYCDSQDGTDEEDMGSVMELYPNQLVLSREHEVEVVSDGAQ